MIFPFEFFSTTFLSQRTALKANTSGLDSTRSRTTTTTTVTVTAATTMSSNQLWLQFYFRFFSPVSSERTKNRIFWSENEALSDATVAPKRQTLNYSRSRRTNRSSLENELVCPTGREASPRRIFSLKSLLHTHSLTHARTHVHTHACKHAIHMHKHTYSRNFSFCYSKLPFQIRLWICFSVSLSVNVSISISHAHTLSLSLFLSLTVLCHNFSLCLRLNY